MATKEPSKNAFYYINTNEIPSELSSENMIYCLREKITVAVVTYKNRVFRCLS